MNYKEYVIQVCDDNYNFGCGVLMGNFFITAGHVIKNSKNPRIEMNGKHIYLKDSIVLHNDNEPEGFDVAVFHIPESHSPLQLSDVFPVQGDVLDSCSWRVVAEGNEYLECNVVVNDIKEGNYFCGDTDILLKQGSSGSPVFYEGDIIGILSRGQEGTSFCAFLSSKVIKTLL